VSAAQWRKAMNSGAAAQAWPRERRTATAPAAPVEAPAPYADQDAPRWLKWIWKRVSVRHVFVLAFVLIYPLIATPFFTFQIGAQSLALGLIALSLTFLGGYGGMISLAQMTVAGIAGYMVAIFGVSGTAEISLGWPWWVVVPLAIAIATVCGTLIGWLSVRTEGIYTIMITLAIGVAFHYLALQNYSVFNGFQGLQKVYPPEVFGLNWRDPLPFYFLALACALAGYFFVKYLARTPFGIALQGIRDNPRRMNALGFNVTAHRVAAYAVAALIAAVGGVLLVWYNGLITPGSIGTSGLINILIIAVLGGMRHPIGPFLGAIVFVLLQNFAIDVFARERFNLVIGGVFLAIVLFSPDGLLGLWARLAARFGSAGARSRISTQRPASRVSPTGGL
jgi:branched-chain amino acid transport system permease protein